MNFRVSLSFNFFCPYYTSQLQVERYLKIKKNNSQKYKATPSCVYEKNKTYYIATWSSDVINIKKKINGTSLLGVARYNTSKIFKVPRKWKLRGT